MKKRNLTEITKKSMSALLVLIAFSFYSCQNDEMDQTIAGYDNQEFTISPDDKIIEGNVTSEVIQEFTASDLLQMKEHLESIGVDVSDFVLPEQETSTRGGINNVLLRAIKVTTKSPHPGDPGREIDLSGVLLVPKVALTSLRLVVVPPPTYVDNAQAPSNVFADDLSLITDEGEFKKLALWTIQAYQGFAVLMPDYPGFGDSRQQCFHPYMVQKPLVNSVIDMTKAAQRTMQSRGYRYKSELIAAGYSQGGYVATSFAKELELNPDHGLNIRLLIVGGVPTNFTNTLNGISGSVEQAYLYLPAYMICGYQSSEYPDIVLSDIFTETYASDIHNYFDGTYPIGVYFPTRTSELFTPDFIENWSTSPKFEVLRRGFAENRIQPWVNQFKMVMVHGEQDDIVNYSGTKNYADEQNAIGGNITFHSIPTGDHLDVSITYYLFASTYLPLYR